MAEIANYAELARLQTDEEAARRRQQQAQQLMQAGYNPVPNANPILSVLASVMSTIKGDSMLKDSDAKMSAILAKRFELQNREDQAKAEAEQRRRQEDWDRELQKIEITAQTGAKYREPKNIDPNSPEGIAARLQFEKGKMGMQPQGAGPAPPAWQKQLDAAKQMGIDLSPEDLKQLVTGLKPQVDPNAMPKAMGAEAAAKVGLYENAMRDAEAYKKAVINPDGSFNDMAAQLPANVRLRESALRAKLRAESGASISPEEARAENDRYGPKIFSSDETNAAAANRLIEDLKHQSMTIRGGSGGATTPSQQEYPDGTVIENAQGQRMVMQGGQWVPG